MGESRNANRHANLQESTGHSSDYWPAPCEKRMRSSGCRREKMSVLSRSELGRTPKIIMHHFPCRVRKQRFPAKRTYRPDGPTQAGSRRSVSPRWSMARRAAARADRADEVVDEPAALAGASRRVRTCRLSLRDARFNLRERRAVRKRGEGRRAASQRTPGRENLKRVAVEAPARVISSPAQHRSYIRHSRSPWDTFCTKYKWGRSPM